MGLGGQRVGNRPVPSRRILGAMEGNRSNYTRPLPTGAGSVNETPQEYKPDTSSGPHPFPHRES